MVNSDIPQLMEQHGVEIVRTIRHSSVDSYPDEISTEHDYMWLYHPRDYPAALLHALVMRGRAAATNVDYEDNYARPSSDIWVRVEQCVITFRIQGQIESCHGAQLHELGDGTWHLNAERIGILHIRAPMAADGTSQGAGIGILLTSTDNQSQHDERTRRESVAKILSSCQVGFDGQTWE